MQKQRTMRPAAETGAPWSLAGVTVITLFLSCGGAAVAVRNLARMRRIDNRHATELTMAIIVVFAVGRALLVYAAQATGASPSAVGEALISIGTAIAVYVWQRQPLVEWRAAHANGNTAPILGAVGRAVVYELIAGIAAVPPLLLIVWLGSL